MERDLLSQGVLFYRTGNKLATAAGGPVGLGVDRDYFMLAGLKRLQRG